MTALRAAIATATATVIIVGDVHGVLNKPVGAGRANATFFVLLAVALLPTVIYAIGVRQPRSVGLYGCLLFGLTAAAWFVVLVSDDPLRGVYTIPAWFVTLVTSTIGAVRDRSRQAEYS